MSQMAQQCDRLVHCKEFTEELEKQYSERGVTLYNKLEATAFVFAKMHPNMEAAVILINYLDVDAAKKLVKLLHPSVLKGRMKSFVDPRINLPSMQTVPYDE